MKIRGYDVSINYDGVFKATLFAAAVVILYGIGRLAVSAGAGHPPAIFTGPAGMHFWYLAGGLLTVLLVFVAVLVSAAVVVVLVETLFDFEEADSE